MKRFLLSAIVATLAFGLSSAYAMTTDDIIQLCKAGFTPERIAKIVDATGLDEPLTASDWARIKREGCDDRLVDALLEVLVPVDEGLQEESPMEEEDSGESHNDDVNVYVRGTWGWDSWNGGLLFGGYDPYWSAGWTYWDPYWDWGWWDYHSYWYANDWWGYPYGHRFGCGPFFYHSHWYNGGYYSSGNYAQHKASRRGSRRDSYYASLKTPQTVRRSLLAKTAAASSFSNASSSGRLTEMKSKSGTYGAATGKAYTTRSKTGNPTAASEARIHSKGAGAVTKGSTSTGAERYGTVKAKGTTHSGSSSGTGSGASQGRSRAKSSRSGESTAPATREKGTASPSGTDGGKGSVGRDSGTPSGSSEGAPTPRPKH